MSTAFSKVLAPALDKSQPEADKIAAIVFETLRTYCMDGNSVRVPGLGVFKLQERPERTMKSNLTGTEITIAAASRVVLKPSKTA